MKYRIVIIETTKGIDHYLHDVDTCLYGKFKYKNAKDAEADSKAIISAMDIIGIKVSTKIESEVKP